jgi:hypothetical protein
MKWNIHGIIRMSQILCLRLKVVGVYRKEILESGSCERWWLSFQTLDGQNQCVSNYDGGDTIHGVTLSVYVISYH